jgi:SGNH domain (fused to AT3 domains)
MRPDTVVISSSSEYSRRDSSDLIDAAVWEKGSRDTLMAIAWQGTAVRLVRDTPHADYDVTSCLAQLAWNGHATCPPVLRARALNSDIYQAELRAAANIANVKVIDMSNVLCGRDSCDTEQGNLLVYQDGDHLTATYVQTLANTLQIELFASPH